MRAAYAQPSAGILNMRAPGFMRDPAPLSTAVDAIERGIERRVARLWTPRWVGAALALRGILQPLTERGLQRDPEALTEAMRLAGPAHSDSATHDSLLGVAMQAVSEPPPDEPQPRETRLEEPQPRSRGPASRRPTSRSREPQPTSDSPASRQPGGRGPEPRARYASGSPSARIR